MNGGARHKIENATLYEIDGVKKSLKDWCRQYRRIYGNVYKRHKQLGWPLKEALETPPLWHTNGRCEGHEVVGSKHAMEIEFNDMKLEELPKTIQKLVKTTPYKGKAPYSGTHFGRFLRESCKDQFDAHWKHVWRPKARADYYHDKHTKISEQKLSGLAATSEGPRYPELDLKRLPLSQSSVAQLAAYAG